MPSLKFSEQDYINNELKLDEKLVWTGQPSPYKEFLKGMIIYLFAVPWLFVTVSSHKHALINLKIYDILFSLPFLLISLLMIVWPFWLYFQSQKTFYFITDKRAVILVAGRSNKIKSFPFDDLTGPCEIKENKNGSGSLHLYVRKYKDSDGDQQTEEIGFNNIFAVREAEMALSKARELYKAKIKKSV